MISPLTGGKVKEVSTTEMKLFRKEEYLVHVRYYVCEDTGEQFTTTEQDTLLFNDLYSQYRTRHGIPFPDEIREIRLNYGLNYSQISRILGFGTNQYAKYEAGEVPSESNGKMLAAIRDKNVILSLLTASKGAFSENEYQKALSSITLSTPEATASPLQQVIFSDTQRGIFNGFGRFDLQRLFDMIRLIVSSLGEVFPTKLNKIMFYADFCHYRKTGQSISGLRYKALAYGPVPAHYDTIYDNTPAIDRKLVQTHGMPATLITASGTFTPSSLSNEEIETITDIVNRFRNSSVQAVIEESHKEDAWKNHCDNHGYIPYDEAFNLMAV